MELFGVLATSSQQHEAPSIDVRQLRRSTFGVISKDFGFQPAGGQFRRFFGKILGADFRVILATGINSEHFWGRFAIEKFDSEGCIR